MSRLHKTWATKAKKVADLDISREDLYHGGASDFQKAVLRRLELQEIVYRGSEFEPSSSIHTHLTKLIKDIKTLTAIG